MISFCGYSFSSGKDILNPMPNSVSNIKNVKIENSIFNYIDITKNINANINPNLSIPVWDINTILNCDFDNGIGAGNVDFTLSQLSSIKIKRRRISTSDIPDMIQERIFDWITIKEIEIRDISDLNTVLRDYFVPSEENFEYAIVPIINGVEGDYIINHITTDFNGVFIADVSSVFKLEANVSYEPISSVQSVGQITPLGRKYPVVVKNGEADYKTGSVTGMILGDKFNENHEIIRKDIVDQTNKFLDFIKDGNPKFLKDWNGNIFLIRCVGNPSTVYNNAYGMGINTVSFQWVEQGKYDNEEDLYDNGFIEVDI